MVSFLKEATGFFCLKFNNNKHYELFWLAKAIEKALEPIVVNILHLPSEFSNVFIMGLIRRDLAASGLFEMASAFSNMTPLQILYQPW